MVCMPLLPGSLEKPISVMSPVKEEVHNMRTFIFAAEVLCDAKDPTKLMIYSCTYISLCICD